MVGFATKSFIGSQQDHCVISYECIPWPLQRCIGKKEKEKKIHYKNETIFMQRMACRCEKEFGKQLQLFTFVALPCNH